MVFADEAIGVTRAQAACWRDASEWPQMSLGSMLSGRDDFVSRAAAIEFTRYRASDAARPPC
jgi:hypothetical protein